MMDPLPTIWDALESTAHGILGDMERGVARVTEVVDSGLQRPADKVAKLGDYVNRLIS